MTRARSSTFNETPAVAELPGAARAERVHTVRPYLFPTLEKVSRRHLTMLRRLDWLIPRMVAGNGVDETVRDRLHGLFDEDVSLWLDYAHLVGRKSLPRLLGANSFLGIISTAPHVPRGLIEIELGFAHSLIGLLLGMAASESTAMRPLTAIEQGVVSYVVLEAFQAASMNAGPAQPRLKLESVADSAEQALAVFEEEKTAALVELKALIGGSAGYVRLLLPGSMVSNASPPEEGDGARARRLRMLKQHLGRLANVRAWLRAEIGGTELTRRDVAGLRAGDVLLLDALSTRCHQGEAGTATLRVGRGLRGHVDATVELVDGHYVAKVERVVLGEPPLNPLPEEEEEAAGTGLETTAVPEEKPWDEDADEPAAPAAKDPWAVEKDGHHATQPRAESPWESEKTNVSELPSNLNLSDAMNAEGAELLNDVPLHVTVELARVAISAEEVVGLHPGKVLELGKAPGDPVNLSVNGKVVARGELVEIEGQLGVRILSLG